MNASELRIGNWVQPDWQEKPIQVTAKLIVEQFQCNLTGTPYLSPIYLNKIDLAEHGFEQVNRKNQPKIFKDENICIFKNKDCYSPTFSDKVRLVYLHELQNLYWDMFKIELSFSF